MGKVILEAVAKDIGGGDGGDNVNGGVGGGVTTVIG